MARQEGQVRSSVVVRRTATVSREVVRRAEEIERELQEKDRDEMKRLLDCERLSAEDLAVRINARG